MNNDIFEKVKAAVNVADVVERFGGLKLNRSHMVCCPFHSENTPSFSVKPGEGIWKCFGCGEGGDAVDFVAKIRGVEPLEAAKLIAEMFGIEDTVSNGSKRVDKVTAESKTSRRDASVSLKRRVKEYIEDCIGHASETDYFSRRGLTAETVEKYRLGYDPKQQRIVLPYSSKLDYYCARSTTLSHDEPFFILKPKTEDAGEEPLFAREQLYIKSGCVFVAESQICALSVMQSGGAAVAICGTNGVGKLLKECRSKKPAATLVLCLDNDEPGRKAQQELANGLFELGVKFIPFNIAADCKDPNELLVKDATALVSGIAEAVKAAKDKYRTAKDSFSIQELMRTKHIPPRHVVENLIVEGLTLLCAPQKIGKSWLVLDLCFSVAAGKDFWAFQTGKCETLYCSLEDPAWRIKDRVKKLFENSAAPAGVHFITEADKLGEGFLEHLDGELSNNPQIGMVVIDTLQRIRKVNSKNNDIYGHDYEELVQLKKFAEKRKVALVVVHHTRKTKDETDPFTNVLGTGGLTGAVDTTLVIMKKKRADKEATLSITGRDVEERDVILEWGGKGVWRWTMSGDAEEMKARRAREEYESDPLVKTVKALMRNQPYGWQGTTTELLQAVFDITGNTAQSSQTVGAKITKWNNNLYYDGICHEEKKIHGSKKHVYYRKAYRTPQYSLIKEGDDENG
jgi:phage/plasmid primase-like uncharacterized protein